MGVRVTHHGDQHVEQQYRHHHHEDREDRFTQVRIGRVTQVRILQCTQEERKTVEGIKRNLPVNCRRIGAEQLYASANK